MSTLLADLPTRRDEQWRWADLDSLRAAAETPRDEGDADPAPWLLPISGPRLVFLDGVFQPEASDARGIEVAPVAAETEHALGRRTGGIGWSLDLAREQVSSCIQIVHIGTGGANQLPAQIRLGPDAAASVVESYVGSGWANRLTQVSLARGARLMRSVRLLQSDGFVSLREEAEVGEAASLVSIFLGAGGMGSRIDGAVTLAGEGAFAEFGGALLTRGEQRQEAAVVLRHAEPEGTSKQYWRAVAADRSTASLAARVDVARDAQKTDGEQSLRGLLLARSATVNLKPELEIFADDVKCAHGATVGELDRRALFYLQSRGLSEGGAKALLTRAFVADALDRIGEEPVREAFSADAEKWLGAAL